MKFLSSCEIIRKQGKDMELLAPAGSREAVIAAIEAGADAVYAGLQEFNARRNAKNLSLHDIRVLSDYIHGKKKKLYLTLNILIKESELSSLFEILDGLARLPVDGLIIQDLGLALMTRKYFPHIPLHASTQMAIHTIHGVRFLEKAGFSRVILARELSIEEIALLRGRTAIDLEVFAHGALCYSLSGLCLASSAIGGHSGNRGLCTQPCRRPVNTRNSRGYYFSTLDLQAIQCLSRLKKAGVKTVKLEGRMKSVDYITTVVKAYRSALDSLNSTADHRGHEVFEDFSRKKTMYYLLGMKGELVNPGQPGVSGLLAGTVEDACEGKAVVRLSRKINMGDRLRLLDENDRDTVMVNTRTPDPVSRDSVEFSDRCEISCDLQVKKGSLLYIAGTSPPDDSHTRKILDELYGNYRGEKPRTSVKKWESLATSFSLPRGKKNSPGPSIRCDDFKWFSIIDTAQVDDIIVPLEMLDSIDSKGYRALKSLKPRIIVDLPLFTAPADEDAIKKAIDHHLKQGFGRWMAENPGHLELMGTGIPELTGGPFLYSMNSASLFFLACHGIKKTIPPLEDEYINMRAVLKKGAQRKTALFSFIPCFITRASTTSFFEEGEWINSSGREYYVKRKKDLTFIVDRKPYAIFQHRERLMKAGNCEFLIDLSFATPSMDMWKLLQRCFRDGTAYPGSHRFNFKRGLK